MGVDQRKQVPSPSGTKELLPNALPLCTCVAIPHSRLTQKSLRSKRPLQYQSLNRLAMQAWKAMHPGLVSWCGALLLNGAEPQKESSYSAEPIFTVDDVLMLEPALSRSHLEKLPLSRTPVKHFPQEGLVDPQMAVMRYIEQAKSFGATFIYHARVSGYPWDVEGDVKGVCYSRSGGRVEELQADVVVLANGTGVERLAKAAGVRIPLLHKPGVLTWIQPGALKLSKIIVSQDLHFLQRPDGLISVGESKETGGASSAAYAIGQTSASGSSEPEIDVEQADGEVKAEEGRAIGERMLASAQRLVPALEGAKVAFVTRGHRPMPGTAAPSPSCMLPVWACYGASGLRHCLAEDGMPVVGFATNSCATRSPSLYIAVCHSGVTLGPLLGAMAALEIVEGVDVSCLSPYRPARFGPGG